MSLEFNSYWVDVAQRQYDWVERMGWHNKTSLEAMALIASEVGEAAAECCDEVVHVKALGEELADIVLRTLDLMLWEKFDVRATLIASEANSFDVMHKSTQMSSLEDLAMMMIPIKQAINCFRKEETVPQAAVFLGNLLIRVSILAEFLEIDLKQCLEDKMALNETRGTRGRVK